MYRMCVWLPLALQLEEVTATELAWISQLVAALDSAWEADHSESAILALWRNLTPTRSSGTPSRDGEDAQQPAEPAAAAVAEAAVEMATTPAPPAAAAPAAHQPLAAGEQGRELSPREALAAAQAALEAAEAEAAAGWERQMRVSVSRSFRVSRAPSCLADVCARVWCVAQLAAASAGVAVVVGTAGALAHHRGVLPTSTALTALGTDVGAALSSRWATLWPGAVAAAGSVLKLLPGTSAPRGLE